MPIEIKIPPLGESISQVEIGPWLKAEGDTVQKDETLVAIESEKATVELPAPESGQLTQILIQTGKPASVGDVVALIEAGSTPAAPTTKATATPQSKKAVPSEIRATPAAKRLLAENNLQPEQVQPSGPGGRLLKEDVQAYLKAAGTGPAETAPETGPLESGGRAEEVVRMSLLRRTIAKRLVESQNNAAILTTFNEIDMSGVQDLRRQHQEAFQARYRRKLGLMSFFVKAAIDALKRVPELNAAIRGEDIVYHNYFDIGVAIGAERGLLVPLLRSAERMSFADIEAAIADFAERAAENRLKPEELEGGTFTISNGGVYGSLLSTPILNPPQSGILGLHAIQERPVAIGQEIVIRPMMNVALSYDHRIVDGREAVMFLKRVKEVIETPARMLIEV